MEEMVGLFALPIDRVREAILPIVGRDQELYEIVLMLDLLYLLPRWHFWLRVSASLQFLLCEKNVIVLTSAIAL